MFRSTALAFSLASVVSLGACSSSVRRGGALYADGRYVEAAEVFEKTEHELPSCSARQKAEYGMYRGLTLLVLGDLAASHRWLAYAYQVERVHPGVLHPRERDALDRGWLELGRRAGAIAPTPTPPGTAIAASGAPAPPPGAPRPPERRSLVPTTQ
jgi:hypothetical protein